MTTSVYKLEKDLCRCCHAEGSFRSLAEPVYNLGHQAVYSDMLKTCLNIELCPMPGDLSSMTYTICEACVLRLRDAHNFKQQVELCELRFKEMYKNIVVDTIIDVGVVKEEESGTLNKGVKMETIEVDIVEEDDDGFDVRFNDSDDEQPIIKVKVEESVKHKPRSKQTKPRTKTKKAPPKRSRLPSDSGMAPEDRDKDDNDTETKKRGEKLPYTIDANKKYRCNFCCKIYAFKRTIIRHYTIAHLQIPFMKKCIKCNIKIPEKSFVQHKEEKHGYQPPFCNICQMRFRSKTALICHQRCVHMRERSVKCRLCNLMLFDSSRLREHMRVHSGKTLICDICSKQFRWRSNLVDHMHIHTGVKRYACKVCDAAFVQKASLNYHMTKQHPEVNF